MQSGRRNPSRCCRLEKLRSNMLTEDGRRPSWPLAPSLPFLTRCEESLAARLSSQYLGIVGVTWCEDHGVRSSFRAISRERRSLESHPSRVVRKQTMEDRMVPKRLIAYWRVLALCLLASECFAAPGSVTI